MAAVAAPAALISKTPRLVIGTVAVSVAFELADPMRRAVPPAAETNVPSKSFAPRHSTVPPGRRSSRPLMSEFTRLSRPDVHTIGPLKTQLVSAGAPPSTRSVSGPSRIALEPVRLVKLVASGTPRFSVEFTSATVPGPPSVPPFWK